ncbi:MULTISPECIES: DUF3806 domain-containing protein [unclassified Dermacoccus]|uniref:DUF3806 domain-containing protein n=1 Tax=unclassified Dermacoccus TaxID=2643059 RepID=UPI00064275CE|nr:MULTISPECIES: DUF3806 domain-containing protein [unclassified Dermacoccus]KLO62770.1 hypothetical protein AA983_09990 [Dermacoccus sp. PE3]MBZ4498072.1 DUF3806 domain-containing protein [Dermacoccus sp. Tok2021]RYI21988.1 DUF3806 domain-containing protein [Dermacoccus sp. 147Ba]
MSEITIEPVGPAEQEVLDKWLDDAARWNIDVTDVRSIDRAYESYVDDVLDQDEDEREDPTPFVAMLGFALGQWLTLESVLEWRVITDADGRDLGLSLPDESSIMFPSDFIADAWNEMRRDWLNGWATDLRKQLEALR